MEPLTKVSEDDTANDVSMANVAMQDRILETLASDPTMLYEIERRILNDAIVE